MTENFNRLDFSQMCSTRHMVNNVMCFNISSAYPLAIIIFLISPWSSLKHTLKWAGIVSELREGCPDTIHKSCRLLFRGCRKTLKKNCYIFIVNCSMILKIYFYFIPNLEISDFCYSHLEIKKIKTNCVN